MYSTGSSLIQYGFEVENIIRSLKKKDSCGYDGISTKILSSSVNYISSPLTYKINTMLSTGSFPDRIKLSEVKPIFKKGEKKQSL